MEFLSKTWKKNKFKLNIQGIPDQLPENLENNEKALQALHTLLFEIEMMEGELICDNCKRVFEVSNSIANVILREDEMEEMKKKNKDNKVKKDKKPKQQRKQSRRNKKEGMDVDAKEEEEEEENEMEEEEEEENDEKEQ